MTRLSERSKPIVWAFVLMAIAVIWLEWMTVKPVLFALVRVTRTDCAARIRVPGRVCHRHGLTALGFCVADLEVKPDARFARWNASLEALTDPTGGNSVRARRRVRHASILADSLIATFGITTLGRILSQSAGNQEGVFSS